MRVIFKRKPTTNYTLLIEYFFKFSYYLGCTPYYFERGKESRKFEIRKHRLQMVSD